MGRLTHQCLSTQFMMDVSSWMASFSPLAVVATSASLSKPLTTTWLAGKPSATHHTRPRERSHSLWPSILVYIIRKPDSEWGVQTHKATRQAL